MTTPAPLTSHTRVKVRFGDSDLLRIAWHGHYVRWFEDARQSLGDAIGIGYEDLIRLEHAAPVVDMRLQYKRPARYGDHLRVTVALHWADVPKLRHTYEIRREGDDELLTTGETTQVLLTPTGDLALNFPDFLNDLRDRWRNGDIEIDPDPNEHWA